MHCRFCEHKLTNEFIDLVNSPLSNSFLSEHQLNEPEIFYPLKLFVCENCWLVQIDEYEKSNKIFDKDYIYFSSFSESWLQHAEKYVKMITKRLGLGKSSRVVEIASNDGYLLQYFKTEQIPCIGIEPTANTAKEARKKGIETIESFFSGSCAAEFVKKRGQADLVLGNNVLAHVPDINDFAAGLTKVLKESGTITMEFPHLLNLIQYNQFDTIYHEHFSYLSFFSVQKIFICHGLEIYDVEELSTHGGSLRIYAKHVTNNAVTCSDKVNWLLEKEREFGLSTIEIYKNFQQNVDQVKDRLLYFLLKQKKNGRKVVAYGAAAKGNTLFNYCGIKKDLIRFVADVSPHKQGKYLPGSHIPVVATEFINSERPDYVLILPWNIREEIVAQLDYIRNWGGKFLTAIPELRYW